MPSSACVFPCTAERDAAFERGTVARQLNVTTHPPTQEEPKTLTAREAKKLARAKKLAKVRHRASASDAQVTWHCALPSVGVVQPTSVDGGLRRPLPSPPQAAPKPDTDDPELQEFLALMQPRSKQKAWADGLAPSNAAGGKRPAPGAGGDDDDDAGPAVGRGGDEDASSSEDDEYQELPKSGAAAAKGKKGKAAAGKGGDAAKKGKKGKGGDELDFLDDTAEEEEAEGTGDDDDEEPIQAKKDLGLSVRALQDFHPSQTSCPSVPDLAAEADERWLHTVWAGNAYFLAAYTCDIRLTNIA